MAERPASVSAADYRATMRHWPSGVAVVTTAAGGLDHGMTVSAFTSVSLEPPLVLVVIDHRARGHGLIAAGGTFCVNVLRASQEDLSDRFAGRLGPLPDRFAGLQVRRAATGAPVLSHALAFVDCLVEEAFVAGDHTLYLGRVVACGTSSAPAEPLVYHDARYRRLADG